MHSLDEIRSDVCCIDGISLPCFEEEIFLSEDFPLMLDIAGALHDEIIKSFGPYCKFPITLNLMYQAEELMLMRDMLDAFWNRYKEEGVIHSYCREFVRGTYENFNAELLALIEKASFFSLCFLQKQLPTSIDEWKQKLRIDITQPNRIRAFCQFTAGF